MNDPDYIATSVSRESSSEEREEQEVRAEQELQEEETENRKGKRNPQTWKNRIDKRAAVGNSHKKEK